MRFNLVILIALALFLAQNSTAKPAFIELFFKTGKRIYLKVRTLKSFKDLKPFIQNLPDIMKTGLNGYEKFSNSENEFAF